MVLGIDLGTTYSVGAYVDESGIPHAIFNSEGDTTTPSVVFFENDNTVVVGQTAKDFRSTEPKRVISTVKNAMGSDKIFIPIPDMKMTPQDVSSLILRKIVQDAETNLNEKIQDVVVTVPSYFIEAQEKATKEAVKLAGLNLIDLMHEPTAAALYYASKNNMDNTNTLVFDLGGGTFDVSIIHINGDNIEELSNKGLNNVGGSFFDQQLVDYVCEEFEKNHDIDLEDEEFIDVYQGLYEKVEKAKKQVCANRTSTVIPINAGGTKDRISITYDYFVSQISSLCERMEYLIKQAIEEAGLTPEKIDQVIMVGGSSRIPYIEDMVTRLIGKTPLRDVNPDLVVGLGASLQADKINKNKKSSIKDVRSHGIGFLRYSLKEKKKINVVLIPRNSKAGVTAKSESMAFARDGQEYVNMVITEGDYEDETISARISETKIPLPKDVKKGMKYQILMTLTEKHDICYGIDIPELKQELRFNLSDEENNESENSSNNATKEFLNKISIS